MVFRDYFAIVCMFAVILCMKLTSRINMRKTNIVSVFTCAVEGTIQELRNAFWGQFGPLAPVTKVSH